MNANKNEENYFNEEGNFNERIKNDKILELITTVFIIIILIMIFLKVEFL